jgi:hypothetical protein
MSRLAIIIGILLIIAGGAGMAFGFVGMPAQFGSMIEQATSPKAEDLCRPGETLDEVTGQSEYTPLEGYRSAVQYYCVDANGERRNVTGTFVQGMIGQVFGGLGSLAIPIVSSFLCLPGIVLVILGLIFSRRRVQDGNVVVRSYTIGNTPNRFQFPDDPNATVQHNAPASGNLSARLSQLEAARQAGLITDDEYERMRQEILDSIT